MTDNRDMKKLPMLFVFLTLPLYAQSDKDVIRQLETIQNPAPSVVCDTCQGKNLYTPAQALSDLRSGKLVYLGRDLFPGSDQNRTCVYKSDKAYILYNNCMASKKEAPATDIEIISLNGGSMKFYIENKGSAPISEMQRSSYDSTWTISVSPSVPPGNLDVAGLKEYKKNNDGVASGGCYVGGSFQAQNLGQRGVCYGALRGKGDAWNADAEAFWKEPGEEWYAAKKLLRKTVVDTKF